MARKFVQVTSSKCSAGSLTVIALCDDGTLWKSYNEKSFEYFAEAPQDEQIDEIA